MQKTKKQENHVIKKYIPSDVIFLEIQNFLAYPLFSIIRLINVFFFKIINGAYACAKTLISWLFLLEKVKTI